jgi:inner membrane transporter RhtA
MHPSADWWLVPTPTTIPHRLDVVPPTLLFVVSAVSQYAGAAIAVLLFTAVPAAGVAWLRILAAAAVMLAWRRPWRRGRPAPGRAGVLIGFGAALGLMNLCFYLAIDRLPLGNAVAIEFLGPVIVAAVGTRTRRDLLALCLALAGVALLVEVELSGNPTGVAFALAAALFWAAYIVLGERLASGGEGLDGLAVGLAVALLLVAPFSAPGAVPALTHPPLLLACLSVGLLSSVIPYGLDLHILTRMSRGRFALLLSLLPVGAALAGAIVLRQVPTLTEAAGIGLVVAGVATRSPR